MSEAALRDDLARMSVPVGDLRLPLLRPEELASAPIKWLKYVLLDRVGLEPLREIERQINRFSVAALSDAEEWAVNRFREFRGSHLDLMVVVKIVPWNKGAQLKNYRLFSERDVEPAFRDIRATVTSKAIEIWCCESSVRKDGFNLGGRFSFPLDSGKQVFEVVWFGSPRLIESMRIPEFHLPYARAARDSAHRPLRLDVLHVPSEYASATTSWAEDLWWIARQLQFRRSSIDLLGSALRSLGASEVCLTFKVSDGHLTIIDWDTQVESTR